MLVAVTGASGLIGTALTRRLRAEGHQVLRLTRSRPTGADQAQWDPAAGQLDPDALAKADAVVHLAAKNIGEPAPLDGQDQAGDASRPGSRAPAWSPGPWPTSAEGTRGAAGAGVRLRGRTTTATGATRCSPRRAAAAAGSWPTWCRQWEAAADPARAAGLRVVHLRTGPVQDAAGAGLPKQALMFRLGLGGRLGSGRQWLSWTSLDDIAGAYLHALTHDDLAGPVNAVAPNPVTNAEFTATLARVLHRVAVLHVPAFAPRLVLGEFADEMLFSSMRIHPARLLETGYRFQFPKLEPALRHTLNR